ncbi:MAG: HEAT repeat domain-containing protein, partial [Candidatus Eremiobacteraeota bacterium]|nr:HEAT repeat domain-containing protein [Candidatus Eremiobacteraeota bacterium]
MTLLAISWQFCSAADAPLRSIAMAELHRKFDPVLVANLDAAPGIAARAALAIGRTKNPAGAAPLRAALAKRDDAVRAMAAYGLGLLADGSVLFDERHLARVDENSAVRYAAIDAIGRIVTASPALATFPAATDVLIVARSDADPIVRAHAVAQLEAFGRARFARQLARALEAIETSDRDDDVRWHAAWTLFRGFAVLADESFLVHARSDSNELVRVETLRAIGRRGDAKLANAVRPLLDDSSWRVQLEARESLKRLAKSAPTEHLTSDPPGLHLPALAARDAGRCAGASATVLTPKPKAAPDPKSFPLPQYVPATTAEQMNGPQFAKHPRVLICTTRGPVVVRLYPEWAPSTVANFIALAQSGYFDGNRWFRIVPDFVVQTGDPTDTGDGAAGYKLPAEENPVEQRTGVIAMGLTYEGSKAVR